MGVGSGGIVRAGRVTKTLLCVANQLKCGFVKIALFPPFHPPPLHMVPLVLSPTNLSWIPKGISGNVDKKELEFPCPRNIIFYSPVLPDALRWMRPVMILLCAEGTVSLLLRLLPWCPRVILLTRLETMCGKTPLCK